MIKDLRSLYRHCRLTWARRKSRGLINAVLSERAAVRAYQDEPKIAAIVQSFNKKENAAAIVSALRESGIEEIVYIDDGSSDGSAAALIDICKGKNEFVIRANDIFEVRAYDRAIDFCRAEIIVLLQDDDLPPANSSWLVTAVRAFENDQRLAIIGGRDGLRLRVDKHEPTGLSYESIRLPPLRDELLYIDVVNRAPMFVRKSAVERLGGIDQNFAPFQCDDVDLCLRAWQAGYRVALIGTDFVRDVGVGGMRIFNSDKVSAQAEKNWSLIRDRYEGFIGTGDLRQLVADAATSID